MHKDITGKRFGMLTAVKPTEKRDSKRVVIWECVCDCGNVCEKSVRHLGVDTVSCGCIKKTSSAKNGKIGAVENTKLGNLNEKLSKNNVSGVKGVCRFKDMWRAYIKINKKQVSLGVYKNFEDAVKARKRAEEEIYEPILNRYGKELKGDD